MNARFLILVALMVVLGVAGSLLLENGQTSDAGPASGVDSWRQPAQPINYSNSTDRFLNALSTGRLFPNTMRRVEQTDEQELQDRGPTIFPTLISISRLDGNFKAFVEYENGDRGTVEKGDPLVDDWTVADMSKEALVAQLNGDLVRIPLFLSEN